MPVCVRKISASKLLHEIAERIEAACMHMCARPLHGALGIPARPPSAFAVPWLRGRAFHRPPPPPLPPSPPPATHIRTRHPHTARSPATAGDMKSLQDRIRELSDTLEDRKNANRMLATENARLKKLATDLQTQLLNKPSTRGESAALKSMRDMVSARLLRHSRTYSLL